MKKQATFISLWVGLACFAVAQDDEELQILQVPAVDIGAVSLTARRAAQLGTVDSFSVFNDFKFEDRLPESGITFVNEVTEDGKKHYKGIHYDHGNGIAVADVDGDGRTDVYFVTQIGRNELWRNLGEGRFENITDAAGVGLEDRVSVTASFADVDNDGDADLYVTTVRMGNVLFENDGQGRFQDVSARSGLDYVGHSSTPVFFDFNRDGLLDCFLANVGIYTVDEKGPGGYYLGVTEGFTGHLKPERTETSILFANRGEGRFEDVSEQVGLVDPGWAGDATPTDFNGDGYLDLYVLNMQGDDHYYENLEGKRFEEKTAALFPKTPWGSMGIKVFDYNNDGLMDLFLTDMHSDMSEDVGPSEERKKSDIKYPRSFLQGGENNIFGNAFYKQVEGGTFVEVSDELGLENYWPWGVSVADLNADGFQDVFIASSMSFPFRYGINSVLLNNRAEVFLPSEFLLGVEPRRDRRTSKPWDVMDCSGEDRELIYCHDREGKYQIIGTLGTRSSVIFDLDGDGDLDIVTNEYNAEPQVLVSDLAERRPVRYLQIDLVGRQSNRDGLGAKVLVVAGEQAYYRVNDGKSGYLSQSALPLYFGLGEAERVDRVEVEWLSGIRQVIEESIPVNQVLVLEEPLEDNASSAGPRAPSVNRP